MKEKMVYFYLLLLTWSFSATAYPCPPWYRYCRLPRCQAIPPARRCRGCLQFIRRFHQDPREHPQGHLHRRFQHLRLPDPQPVEGDQADQIPSGGVLRHPEGRQAILREETEGVCSGAEDWKRCAESRYNLCFIAWFGRLRTLVRT